MKELQTKRHNLSHEVMWHCLLYLPGKSIFLTQTWKQNIKVELVINHISGVISVLNVLGLSKGQKEEVKSLMELHLGVRSEAVEFSGSGEAGQVKTLDDLGQPHATSVCPQPKEDNVTSKGGAWTLCQDDFSEVPFGECPDNPGSFLDHYYPTLASEGAGDECEEASFLNDFDVDEVVRVSWSDVKALKNGSVRGSMNYYDPTASPAGMVKDKFILFDF